MVVVNRLSSICIPLRIVAEVFVREVVRLHGVPKPIVNDRDPAFISYLWSEYLKLHETLLKMSSSYHPETDEPTEVLNRCLETYLRFLSEQPKFWAEWRQWAEFWYNIVFHTAVGMSPFEVVYGRAPPSWFSIYRIDICGGGIIGVG